LTVPSCKARAIGRKPHGLNLNLQGWNRTLIATAPDGGAAGTDPYSFRGPYPPPGSRSVANRFKGLREAPTSRSRRPTSTERGIAYGARAPGRRSPRSSRRSHDRPGRPVTPGTGRRGTGDLTDLHPEEIGQAPPAGPAHLVGQAAARRHPPLA